MYESSFEIDKKVLHSDMLLCGKFVKNIHFIHLYGKITYQQVDIILCYTQITMTKQA